MIARVWHGTTRAEQAEAYGGVLARTGLVDYEATPGNRGVFVLRRDVGDVAHFLVLTLWESEEAIRQFAGEEISATRYYPDDANFLLELEPEVAHYEVVYSRAA